MQWESESLDAILAGIWSALREGAADRKNPMRTPVLATRGADGPRARTVVLRGSSEVDRALAAHADRRSDKIKELQACPRVTWCFYDAAAKVQLRVAAEAHVLTEGPLFEEAWARTGVMSRRNYLAESAPGTARSSPGSGLPGPLEERSPTEEESVAGKVHFALIRTVARDIDWLFLRARGHRRARFRWDGVEWAGQWLTP